MNNYPYIDTIKSINFIKNKFKLFKKKEFKELNNQKVKYSMKDIYLNLNWDEYEDISIITDYFSERCRVKCKFLGKELSPLEYFEKNKKKIMIMSMEQNKFSLKKFSDYMYYNSKFCNKFNIYVALFIYKLFKPKSVLDSSSGWGDRLIAAIAYGTKYTGYDPSECLESIYPKIIDTLATNTKKKNYNVYKKPFEEVEIKEKYDLVFSSPPFFDLETYENTDNQSIVKYKNKNTWIKKFLFKLVDNNIKGLKKGGYLVLYLPLYDKFADYMNKNKLIKYCGKIKYRYDNKSKLRDIYIWKKI